MDTGWESLLLFVKNSILNGNKEVALAAINCLQSTVLSHSPKVNIIFSASIVHPNYIKGIYKSLL